jgi:ribosome-binding factor A
MSQRTERVDELLRQEIGELLRREVADPRIGFVTITRVDTAPDLSHARVWVSIIGQQTERQVTLGALRRAMPFIRHQLGGRVRLRRIPDLHVELDETAERGTRVLRLLHELEEGRVPDEAPVTGESLPTPTARIPLPGEEPAPPAPTPAQRQPRRPQGGGTGRAGGPGGARGSGSPAGRGQGGTAGGGGSNRRAGGTRGNGGRPKGSNA